MSEAPERIWVWGWRADSVWQEQTWQHEDEPMSTMEYVRVDLVEAAEQRGYANAMEAERKLHEARIEELEAKLENVLGGAETVLEAWDHHTRDAVVPASLHDAIEELRADVVEALTGSATVKESLTTEDEKQSHEWKCPIDYPGCRKNCGSYGCGN